jgi:NADH dehydrogenase (ubiquinone) 1 alpha/beta subcomplex 1
MNRLWALRTGLLRYRPAALVLAAPKAVPVPRHLSRHVEWTTARLQSTLLSTVGLRTGVFVQHQQQRFYTASKGESGLSRASITERILEVLKGYDKVDVNKLTPDARFTDDLGLDSLDAVEVVMAIEEEFSIEIPDKDADEIRSTNDAINYIAGRTDAV